MEKAQAISTTEQNYPGFWVRVAALILDSIVLNAALSFILLIFHRRYGIFNVDTSGASLIFRDNPETIIVTLAQWTYNVLMLKYYGATLGKMAMRIKVIGADKELDWVSIILRETIGKMLSGIILGIGYLMVAWDPKKQALHDKIAGTLVVRE